MLPDSTPTTPATAPRLTTPPPQAVAKLPARPVVSVSVRGRKKKMTIKDQVKLYRKVKRELFIWARKTYAGDAAGMLQAIKSRRLAFVSLGGIAPDHARTATAIENREVTIGNAGPVIDARFSPCGFLGLSGCKDPHFNKLISRLEKTTGFDGNPLGKRFDSLQALLEDPEIGTVSLLGADVPSKNIPGWSLRGETALKVVNSRKNVLLEKPPFHSEEEAKAIMKAADLNGVTVFTAYHAAATIALDKLREKLTEHRNYGQNPIEEITINYAEYVYKWHKPGSWVTGSLEFPRGMMEDSGINAISALQALLSDANGSWPRFNITGGERHIPTGKFGEFYANIDFEFLEPPCAHGNPAPAKGNIRLDWANPNEDRIITVRLKDGTKFVLDVVLSSSYIIHPDGTEQEVVPPPDKSKIDMHREQYTMIYRELAERLYTAQNGGLRHTVHTAPVVFVNDVYKENSLVEASEVNIQIPMPRPRDKNLEAVVKKEFLRLGSPKSLFY